MLSMVRLTTVPRIIFGGVCMFILASSFYLFTTDASKERFHKVASFTSTSLSGESPVHISKGFQQPLTHTYTSVKPWWQVWCQLFVFRQPRIPDIHLDDEHPKAIGALNVEGFRQPARLLVNMTNPEIADLRDSHELILSDLESGDFTKKTMDLFKGQGVVILSNSASEMGATLLTIRMLRHTGSELPVEVFVPGPGEYEDSVCNGIFPKLNAKCVKLTDLIDREVLEIDLDNAQKKAMAILLSSFTQVLYLDSSALPLIKPEELLSSEPFIATGLVLWPDFWTATDSSVYWRVAGFPTYPNDLPPTASDSGQILVNKSTHLKTLILAAYYNTFGPRHWYRLLHQNGLGAGEKETYLAAAVALNLPYRMVARHVDALGYHTAAGEWRGTGMLQYNPNQDMAANPPEETSGLELIPLEDGFEEPNAGDMQQLYKELGRRGAPTKRSVKGEKRNHARNWLMEKAEVALPIGPAFIQANAPKLDAGRLADKEGDGKALFVDDESTRTRLYGAADTVVAKYGFDVEKVAWEYIVKDACTHREEIREWNKNEKLCEQMQQHWNATFA